VKNCKFAHLQECIIPRIIGHAKWWKSLYYKVKELCSIDYDYEECVRMDFEKLLLLVLMILIVIGFFRIDPIPKKGTSASEEPDTQEIMEQLDLE
jgi:hypothetical protein